MDKYLKEEISKLLGEDIMYEDITVDIERMNELEEEARRIAWEMELRKIFPPPEEDILFGANWDPDPEPEPLFDYSDLVRKAQEEDITRKALEEYIARKALEEEVAIGSQDRFQASRSPPISRRSFMRTKPHRPSRPRQLERMREMERDRRREEERRIKRLFGRRARTPVRANEWNQLGERRRNLD